MKLAIVILKYFPFGRLQRDFMQIAEEMHRRGHQIITYTMRWEGPQPDWMKVRCLRVFGFTNRSRTESFFHRLSGAVRKDPPDLLLGMCHCPGLDVYFAGTFRFRTCSAEEDPILNPNSKTEILCIIPDQVRQLDCTFGIPQTRIHLLPPGIRPEFFRSADAEIRRNVFRENHQLAKRIVLLCIGTDLMRKGADRVIASVATLPDPLREQITILMLGKPSGNLEKKAESCHVEIRFEGMHSDVMEYYLGADLMVLPAKEETAGTVILEALAAGLPVLCTENCTFSSCVRESGAGYVLPEPFSGENLSMALESFLVHPERLRPLGDAAADYAKTTNLTGRAAAAADIMETLFHAKTCAQ